MANDTLTNAFEKLRFSQALDGDEVAAVEKFTDTFVTCTRCVSVAGEDAVRKAEDTIGCTMETKVIDSSQKSVYSQMV